MGWVACGAVGSRGAALRCWHPCDIFPPFLLRPFSLSDGLGLRPSYCGYLLHFHVLLATLGLGVLLWFFLRPLLFHFPDPWTRAYAHTLALLLVRTLSLSLAGAHVLHARVGFLMGFPSCVCSHILTPPWSLLPCSLPFWGCGWPGGGSTPSSGCGCAAPGAFVLVCVVRFGQVGLCVSCALFQFSLSLAIDWL